VDARTPVIIGVGEASERIGEPGYQGLSPVELAARAAQAALDDTRARVPPASHIGVLAAVRQFETSGPNAQSPFGRSNNFPRSVARRIGADPRRAILEPVGGQGPQHLVNEFAKAIAQGEMDLAMICGAEAISTLRRLLGQGETRDWSETVGGDLEDRGYGMETLVSPELNAHGVRTAIQHYAIFENARRAKRGLDRKAYALEMGELFAPFTNVAAENPHAMSHEVFDAPALATITERNRMVADPFPRRMVSRDQTNQGAAVLIASAAKARELGVPEDRWVYLHGAADVAERKPLERADLSAYPAAGLAARAALERAGIGVDDVALFDLYSCFPIAVFDVRDELGMKPDDPRPLTLTGGLPFFGGAGNNYSMHAIASAVRGLRERPGAYGFVGANGGFLSKYSVGVYSTEPVEWREHSSAPLQAQVDSWAAPAAAPEAASDGVVESYTIDYGRGAPIATLVCRAGDGGRFCAMSDPDDPSLAAAMGQAEPLAARVATRRDERGRRILSRFDPA